VSSASQNKNRFSSDAYGQKSRIELRFYFSLRGRGPAPSSDLQQAPRISISPALEKYDMRPETQRNIDDIEQAFALLRRHL
jgi:hypothetical protein